MTIGTQMYEELSLQTVDSLCQRFRDRLDEQVAGILEAAGEPVLAETLKDLIQISLKLREFVSNEELLDVTCKGEQAILRKKEQILKK